MIWLTGDWHLSHANIIKYTERPYKSEREMDYDIIRRYTDTVNPRDVVYFLGDLSMRRRDYKEWYIRTFSSLPGEKHLILGNHDTLPPFDYVEAGFMTVHTALEMKEFVLVHDPAVSQVDLNRKFICGHVHKLFTKQNNVVNVGVDVWDFKPVSLDEVKQAFEKENY